ncbi:MAG: glycosyl hydrolase [Solirubrobacterales bacterium]
MRSARKRLLGAVTALALALSMSATAVGAPTVSVPAKAPTGKGLYWGAWLGDQLTGTQPPWDMSAVSKFERTMGRGLSIVQFAAPFADCARTPCTPFPFPTAQMRTIRAYGAIPFLSWSSASLSSNPNQPDFQLGDVIRGDFDPYIREFAREAAAWGQPFFLRFDWEMNGTWFPWGEGANGNKPGEFVSAWRHVHDLFAAAGASNATWTWCPYAGSKHAAAGLRRYYPGSAYVDWTCMDGYNWGRARPNTPWMSFDEIFGASYWSIQGFAHRKPMLLGELASNGPNRRKAAWINEMFSALPRYPLIRGLVWFDQFDRGIQWPVETAPGTAAAFSSGIRNNPFRGNQFGSISASPIQPPR